MTTIIDAHCHIKVPVGMAWTLNDSPLIRRHVGVHSIRYPVTKRGAKRGKACTENTKAYKNPSTEVYPCYTF